MSRQSEREDFIARMARRNIGPDIARQFMRHARTLQRLAEASCNGDYPADNGERPTKECGKCHGLWAPSFIRKSGICGECSLEARFGALVAGLPFHSKPPRLITQGDPRGYVARIAFAGERDDDAIGVPS